jgi:hypothetical protein
MEASLDEFWPRAGRLDGIVCMYVCIFFVRGGIGPESPLLGHRTCWAREVGIYLHAIYRNAIGYKGLVIRNAKLVFRSVSDFCKRVSRPHSIQHIIGTNGASYRACYPSAGRQGRSWHIAAAFGLISGELRSVCVCAAARDYLKVVPARWRAWWRPSSGREHTREEEKVTKEMCGR